MYWILALILIIGVLLVLIIMIQNPKDGGLAANFSSSNKIMGARQTTDFLEKATWTMGIAILVLSVITSFMANSNSNTTSLQNQSIMQKEINQAAIPISNNAINKAIPMPKDVKPANVPNEKQGQKKKSKK